MSMTPIHPLAMADRALSREELVDLISYEGLIGIDPRDLEECERLAADGLISIEPLRGQPHACLLRREEANQPPD